MFHTEHILIKKPREEVFNYLAIEKNHPTWGVNFMKNYEKTNKGHFVDTPMGRVSLEILSNSETGVIDVLLGGKPTHSRVLSISKKKSAYIFTLILPDELPEDAKEAGIIGLREELKILKSILEGSD